MFIPFCYPEAAANVPGGQSIVNTTFCTNALCGYNTTPGGSKFLQLAGGNATFSFSPGTSAFGAYLTGVQLDGETITFNDGSSQSVAIPNPGGAGGTDFVGFTDASKSIASILINVQFPTVGDINGIDDVRYVSAAVPAPLIGGGLPVVLAVGGVLFGATLLERSKQRRSLGTAT